MEQSKEQKMCEEESVSDVSKEKIAVMVWPVIECVKSHPIVYIVYVQLPYINYSTKQI